MKAPVGYVVSEFKMLFIVTVSLYPACKVFVFMLVNVITLFEAILQLAEEFILDKVVEVNEGLEHGPFATHNCIGNVIVTRLLATNIFANVIPKV